MGSDSFKVGDPVQVVGSRDSKPSDHEHVIDRFYEGIPIMRCGMWAIGGIAAPERHRPRHVFCRWCYPEKSRDEGAR